jgi:hypothetical protein
MTDHDFERRVGAVIRELGVKSAPPTLRASVGAIPDEILGQQPLGWTFPGLARFASIALLAAAAVAIVLVGLALLVPPPNVGPPDPGPGSTEPAVTPRPTAPTAAPSIAPETPNASGGVRGWPTTRENEPGEYSWNGVTCAAGNCILGWMHNGYGSGNLEIWIRALAGGVIEEDDGTPTTVAGHDGRYELLSDLSERWMVDVDGTVVSITLTARAGTIEEEIAEAHAIIESMRTEPDNSTMGFRLIFTLATDDWDSG